MADWLALHSRRQTHDRHGVISVIGARVDVGIALGVAALIFVPAG